MTVKPKFKTVPSSFSIPIHEYLGLDEKTCNDNLEEIAQQIVGEAVEYQKDHPCQK